MNQKIFFTAESGNVKNRAKYIRGGLFRNGYSIFKQSPTETDDQQSLWFHGLTENQKLSDRYIKPMEAFRGKLVFFRNDDSNSFFIDQIPSHLFEKSHRILRNHWPSNSKLVDPNILEKSGFINPILKPNKSFFGKDLIHRENDITFYGKMTGGNNLHGNENARVKGIEICKGLPYRFKGGLIPSKDYNHPKHLEVIPIKQIEHMHLLNNTKICLAFWGNSPLTYRLFEGLASRCLVIAQSLESIKFANCMLEPNKHFLEVKPDLSDLEEKIYSGLNDLHFAQDIANNGYNHFKKHFEFDGVNLPQTLYEEIISTWNNILQTKPINTINYHLRKFILSHTKSI